MRNLTYQTLEKIIELFPDIKNIKTFMETGTYKGGTVFQLAPYFKKLYTIEINQNAYLYCRNLAEEKGVKNIKFYFGDGAQIMSLLIPHVNQRSIYFLDSHVTENGSGLTGRFMRDVPLLDELKLINNLDPYASVIIVDDFRLFGKEKSKLTAGADWSDITLEKVLSKFDKGRVRAHFPDPDYDENVATQPNDRYIILLNPKTT